MIPYADTNLFTRLYLRMAESEVAIRRLERAMRQGSAPLPVTWLHRIELLNAFQLHVFASRDSRQNRVTPEQAAAAQAMFRADLTASTFLRRAETEGAALESQFEELALRHSARHGFRAYDLLHVAAALVLGCDEFWSFDAKAARLAELEGLRVHD